MDELLILGIAVRNACDCAGIDRVGKTFTQIVDELATSTLPWRSDLARLDRTAELFLMMVPPPGEPFSGVDRQKWERKWNEARERFVP